MNKIVHCYTHILIVTNKLSLKYLSNLFIALLLHKFGNDYCQRVSGGLRGECSGAAAAAAAAAGHRDTIAAVLCRVDCRGTGQDGAPLPY